MRPIAIRCEGLGKRYRIGQREPYKALRDTLTDALRAPLGAVRRRLGRAERAASTPGSANGAIWALREVSFEVKQGEVLGVIGRNGMGKTTLLKILSRITDPTEGYAEINGRVGSLLEVGTGFHPELTGWENIYLNGAILGMKKAEIDRRISEIVAFAEVEKFIDTPVKYYSSGMYVRLAFAVAAHLDPEILLVDEVLAVGDHEFQRKCLGRMGDISREGRTVLLVSHNMTAVLNLCQRAILLDLGLIVAEGPATAVVQRYLSSVSLGSGEVVWPDATDAPGNDLVRLHAVRVLQEGTVGPTSEVDVSKELLIQLEYWNLQSGALIYPAIWLRDQLGAFVLASSNHRFLSLTDDPWNGQPHPAGLFRSVCRIPGDLLNERRYSITAIVGGRGYEPQALAEDVVSFNVRDMGDTGRDTYDAAIGTVRPRLAWHTDYAAPLTEAVEECEADATT